MSSSESIVVVQALCVERGGSEVIREVSFTLQPQETLVIIGQSGCGKTTLLRSIIGLVPICGGSLHVLGRDAKEMKEVDWNKLRLKLGYCFQEGALFDSMNVYENVAFPLKMHTSLNDKQRREKVRESLARMGLEKTLDLMPNQLSGGMRRRVGLARALIMDPELVLFDEPTAGLDPARKNSIVELIDDLDKALQVTSIVVTHDMAAAEKLASRIGMLHEGKLLALESPERIRKHPDPIVRGFIEGKLSAV